jgi:AcrR family transcriptional regulator
VDHRKPREDASIVRERVLDAAMRLAAARGFDAVSVQDFASACSLSKQALLHHFGSKDQLRAALIDRVTERTKARIPAILAALADPEQGAGAATDQLIAFVREEPDIPKVILRELLDAGEVPRIVSGAELWMTLAIAFVRDGQVAGRFREDLDPDAFLITLSSLILATAALAQQGGDGGPLSVDLPRRVREAVRMISVSLLG